jgi:hypothetical protein
MQREARFYAVYACLGVVVLAYAVSFAITAWTRFGPSGTFAVYGFVSLLFAALSGLAAFVSFSFQARSIGALNAVSGGYELLSANEPRGGPTHVKHLRHIRTIGKQFVSDESKPAFVFFSAAGRVWVAEASTYQAAVGGLAR